MSTTKPAIKLPPWPKEVAERDFNTEINNQVFQMSTIASLPLITQSRVLTRIGIYNEATNDVTVEFAPLNPETGDYDTYQFWQGVRAALEHPELTGDPLDEAELFAPRLQAVLNGEQLSVERMKRLVDSANASGVPLELRTEAQIPLMLTIKVVEPVGVKSINELYGEDGKLDTKKVLERFVAAKTSWSPTSGLKYDFEVHTEGSEWEVIFLGGDGPF